MTLMDYHFRHVPEYYPSMYLDGYSPDEIKYAARKKYLNDIYPKEEPMSTPIILRSEVFVNGKKK